MKMSGKRVKWPSSWLPPDENIDNIARIELPYETQRALGCAIGEHVFLEYPWAYITRDIVLQHACQNGSSLDIYKDKIENYKGEYLLVGYASKELTSNSFVICLTEQVRDSIVKRNRKITICIHKKVQDMIFKNCHNTPTFIVEETQGQNNSINSSRSLFEVELTMNINVLKKKRQLIDRNSNDIKDGYTCLVPNECQKFNHTFMQLISKGIQTNLEPRDTSIQTYLCYPHNKWTQCNDTAEVEVKQQDKEVIAEIEKSVINEGSSPAGLSETITEEKASSKEAMIITDEIQPQELLQVNSFLQFNLSQVIDYCCYNSKINMHSDDIENLVTYNNTEKIDRISLIDYYLYNESRTLIDLSITKGRVISDVTWHPNHCGFIAISYLTHQSFNSANTKTKFEYNSNISILIWSIIEPVRPKLLLENPREIQTISFCPYRPNVIVGGSTSGQIVLWDLGNKLNDQTQSTLSNDIPVITASASSEPYRSHLLSIRGIEWLPPNYRIEDNGMLNKLTEDVGMQFMTSSEDGTVAIWDLLWQPNLTYAAKNLKSIVTATMSLTDDLERLDGVFRPHYKLHVQLPKESFNLTVLDFCLSSPANNEANNPSRKLWLSTAQGEIISCTWHGQEFEVTGEETIDLLECASTIHDGPVIKIIRCQYLQDILLTIGGGVFAIWRDDYLKHPVIWRKRDCLYTACSWSHRPGVFVVARCDGDLETWDICRKTRQPVQVQTISGKLITGLYTQDLWPSYPNFIGICDYNGTFRVVNEVNENLSNHSTRIHWFRKFIDREIERKKEFHAWQDNYLSTNKIAVERKAMRITEEAKKRHQEAREKFLKEKEDEARRKAERKAKLIIPSKQTILQRKNLEVIKKKLLEKKNFDPQQLDEIRYPLVQQQDQKVIRNNKAKARVAERDSYFAHAIAVEFSGSLKDTTIGPAVVTEPDVVNITDEFREKYQRNYFELSTEAKRILKEAPQTPKFNWTIAMNEGQRRRELLNKNTKAMN